MKTRDRLYWLSELFIHAGALVMLCAALFWAKTALASELLEQDTYLASAMGYQLPLPTLTATPTLVPAPISTQPPAPVAAPVSAQPQGLVAAPSSTQPPPSGTPQVLTPTPRLSKPARKLAASAGPVTRLKIPRLNINRAVIPIGLHNKGGQLQWNTDVLFSTSNRSDLVGQPVTSVNPGDGGNIILVGHNYNNGWNSWGAVFVNLKSLQPGDPITLYTKNGGEFQYVVQRVKQVPWLQKDASELEKHLKYLWPTESEQLTLVTCGGANLFSWSARIYVVALPKVAR
ncbi:MAG: sortase [Anaerolineales bacterium]|nr:sortase [Anaerolineales bacterium]